MGIWIIGALTLISIGIYLKTRNAFGEEFGKIFNIVLGGVLVWGFSLLVGNEIAKPAPYYEYKDLPIQSAYSSDNQELHGSFILGCGTVSGSTRSVYIVQGKFAQGMKRINLNTDYTYVNETDSESPKIEKYYSRRVRSGYSSWWLIKDREQVKGSWVKTASWQEKTLVVPTSTVKKQFDIN